MTPISPTALEAAAKKLDPDAFAIDEFGCYALVSGSSRRASARTSATSAITAYLAQREKEGFVMVPSGVVELRRFVLNHYDNQDMSHVDFRVNSYQVAAAQNGGE